MKCIMGLVLAVILSLMILKPLPVAESFHYEVGDQNGWSIPPNEDWFYNEWASKHRFQVNDTLRFQYKDDSVMVVKDGDYRKCVTRYPVFFSNNGNTMFTLNESGSFYFMSGVSGHCQRGQRMIVRVLEERPDSDSDSKAPPPPTTNGGTPNVRNDINAYVLCLVLSFAIVLIFG